MSVKYHISSTTERPNICRAKTPDSCPLKGDDGTPPPHFESKEEARAYVEKKNEEKYDDVPTTASSRASESSESFENSENENLETIKTTASSIRAGDVLSGQKFVNGRWKDDDAKVVRVSNGTNLDGSSRVEVTYENGNTAVYAGKSAVTVKRPPSDEEGYKFNAAEADKNSLNMYRKTRKGYVPDEKEAASFLQDMKDSEPSERAGIYTRRIGEFFKYQEMHHEATLYSAQSVRIKMSNDLNYQPTTQEAHDLIYSNNVDGNKSEAAESLRNKYPQATKIADSRMSDPRLSNNPSEEEKKSDYKYSSTASESIARDAYRDIKNGKMDERESKRVLKKLKESEPSSVATVYSGMIAQKLDNEGRHHEANLFKAHGIELYMKENPNHELKNEDAYYLFYASNINDENREEPEYIYNLRKEFPAVSRRASEKAADYFYSKRQR